MTSSIKMTPTEASKKNNEGVVYFNLYGDMEQISSKSKFKIGDKVRISKYKRKTFDKGYTPNWTEEILTVDKIQYTNPITYKIKDLNNEEIHGSFYEAELLKAKQDVSRIDKVIKREYKKKLALVKWKGYNDDFNSWIPVQDLTNILKNIYIYIYNIYMTLKPKSYAFSFKSLDTPAFKKDIDDMIKNLDQNVKENKTYAIVFGPDNVSSKIFKC